MAKDNVIVGIIVAILTATTTPWWWDKVFPSKNASASPSLEAPAATADTKTLAPRVDAHRTSEPEAPPAPTVPPLATIAPGVNQLCPEDGAWYLQVAAGDDKPGLIALVDKIRAAGDDFRAASLFEAADGKYRVAIGCFQRFAADELQARFAAAHVLSTPTLVTQGKSLTRRVY